MELEEVAQQIEGVYLPSMEAAKVKLTCGTILHGTFESFNDYVELRKDYKFRFVLVENSVDFNLTFIQDNILDSQYSIIIDSRQIEQIENLSIKKS
ncbi:MAG: hypothetical protein H0W73_11410 [Bacteroidetes bacterium]|nr:hypothetical protein [Bacteroidota bacterium]